jgi:hypothetical protein
MPARVAHHIACFVQALRARDLQGAEAYVRGTSQIQVHGRPRGTSSMSNGSLFQDIRVHMPDGHDSYAPTTVHALYDALHSSVRYLAYELGGHFCF